MDAYYPIFIQTSSSTSLFPGSTLCSSRGLSIQRVQCAIFNVADIARAHDWHIALAARRKMDRAKSQENGVSKKPMVDN